ncbi:uncharacterized protein LOC34618374 [Cyclospora cayetanensis]|uniref:Uncharacterized protein LOC34618374 n=1 Tax=Cyclospora cayetanensis TaxID=88456 RepID=A0A6P6RQH0_9EIME|nr:uncharacterized protein LOC34618374 [Cyclospora cayetanensis]
MNTITKISAGLAWVLSSASAEYTEWCQAAPEHGKPEFAVCAPHGAGTANYMIEIVPSFGSGVDLANDVSIQIVGSTGRMTPLISIASTKSGTHKRIFTESLDIGDPEEIRAVLTGSRPWKCQRMIVWKDFRYWMFDCIGTLTSKHRESTFTMSGNKMYEAIIQTGNDEQAGTIGSIELTMTGTLRQASPKIVLEGVKPGEEQKVAFRASDVGDIQSILLYNSAADDPWFCESLRIVIDGGSVTSFSVKRWIGSPFQSSVVVTLRPSLDTDMSPQDVQCHTRGTDLVSMAPSHLETFKVRCPMNCSAAGFGLAEGASIHPGSSSVCAAAESDGVTSASGGVLVVTVVGPLPQYSGIKPLKPGEEQHAFELSPGARGDTFSFFLYRSDSIDDIVSDIRVVDAHGKLSASGRLELRRNGVWGTVCKQGAFMVFTEDSARKACHQMGYLHGMYHEDGCLNLYGHNVCAGSRYPVAAAEKSFYDCTFEEPTQECTNHKQDVAIVCSNNPPAEPIYGALRIVNEDGSPALDGTGRLQVYKNGWGSICDDGWTKESERVACMQMGYTGMKNGGLSGKSCEDINGLNFCGLQEEPIHMVNVACEGDEAVLRSCSHETKSDIYCAHSEDVVVSCRGDGDPTGTGAGKKEDLPDVVKRKYRPIMQLACSDRAVSKKGMIGEPGAVFLGFCPSGCGEEPAEIRGTFVYTDDSSICKAAIHAGAIGHNGGEIAIVLGYGQQSYWGSTRNGVTSETSEAQTKSCKVLRGPQHLGRHRVGAHLMTSGTAFRLQQMEQQGTPIEIPPKFEWGAPQDFAGFRGKRGDFVDLSELPGSTEIAGFSDFTIAVHACIKGGKGHWRTMVSHSGCGGLLLAVNEAGEIVLEHNCDPHIISTGIVPAVDERFHLVVTFFSPEKRVSIYYNGEKVVSELTDFDFNIKKNIIIGRAASTDTDYFVGTISSLQVFNNVLSPDQVKFLATQVPEAVPTTDILSGGERRTVDGRVCLSPCSPEEPFLEGEHQWPHPTNPAVLLSCTDNGWLPAFNGFTDSRFLITCPEDCHKAKAPLKGNKVYTPDSSVCKAAIHVGVLDLHGGEAVLVVHNGINNYASAQGKHDDGSLVMHMKIDELILVSCPPGCLAASDARVYGTKIYSPLSSVCRAAIHAGALGADGGQVEIRAMPKHDTFSGSEQNGVVSLKGDSYLRSFEFRMPKHAGHSNH